MQLHARSLAGGALGAGCLESLRGHSAAPRAACSARPSLRAPVAVQASSLDSSGLTSNSSLLGPSAPQAGGGSGLGPKLSTAAAPMALEDVELVSGVSFSLQKSSAPAPALFPKEAVVALLSNPPLPSQPLLADRRRL